MNKGRSCCDDDFSALSTKLRCLLVLAVVVVGLTAVFVPLYYLVFRPYFAQFWTTWLGALVPPDQTSEAPVVWQADCPQVPVLEWNRFDCYPDEPRVTQKLCEDRGCCWLRTDAAVDNTDFFRDPIPVCIFPRNYGYVISGPEESVLGGFQLPLQRIPAPSRYGDDVTQLKVLVEMQTPYRLRVKIFDPSDDRYEVPDPAIPVESSLDHSEGQVQMYAASYSMDRATFSLQVRRAQTGTVLFDTGVGALTFAQQFVQLSAALPSSRVYGLGEHVHERFARDTHWRTWTIFNRDAYPEDFSNLYGSHPMYMCVEKDLKAHAVLLLNSNAMEIQLQPTPAVTFRTTGGVLDFYFFLGPRPEDVVKQYTEAVGRPMMPPYWALGFHLGRWGYRTTEFVRDVQKKMRDMDMPQDVIHLDKDYQSNYRVFTLDQSSFAKLPQLVRKLRNMGQRVMLVIEPAVSSARDRGAYSVYDTGERLGVFVNDTWGALPVQGLGWPGAVVFPDFGNPSTQSWWTEQLRQFRDTLPFDGIWISGNEPSNYANGSTSGCLHDDLNRPPYVPKMKGSSLFERTLCMDAVHWIKGKKQRHYDVHSLYGHTMAVATVNSLRELLGARRGLVMSRSTFVGSGRYAGHWLGDNASRWPDMARSVPAILDFSLFGIPLVGADICGFYDDAQEELCLRWTQLGIFYPLVRNNNAIDSSAQDPSAFSEEFQSVVRRALGVRYELLPFLYTLFHWAHTSGSTVARPLFHVFPDDSTAFDVDRQFMWGDALLITPVLQQGVVSVEGYFPAGTWYDYHTGRQFSRADSGQWLTVYSPLSDPERPCNLHLRGGHVLPIQAHGNTTRVSRKNPMKLMVALNSSGEAYGDLYWDDGEMRDAHTLGEYIYLTFKAANNTLTILCFQYRKLFRSTFDEVAIMSVRVLGLAKRPTKVELDDFYQLSRRQYRWHHSNKVMDLKNILIPLRKNTTVRWSVVS